jgi:hypothetical protein
VIHPAEVEGAFDVCSAESARSCVDQCEARIAGIAPVCASCLVEDAYFWPDGDGYEVLCEGTTCSIQGPGGTCTFPEGDRAAQEDCVRVAFPRREVACEPRFRPVTECASVCE